MPRVIDQAILDMLKGVTGERWDETTLLWDETTLPWSEQIGPPPTFSVAFLVDIAFPAPNHLRFTTKMDNIDFNGETFFGLGSVGSVSMPVQDGELSPSQYEIGLSGINDDVLEAVTQLNYMNHKATAWIQYMDADFQNVGSPQYLWGGLTDGAVISYGKRSTVKINIRDRMVDWARPKLEYYNNGDQQKLHPEDKGFEFIAGVSQKDAPWPEAEYLKKTS